MKTVILKLTSAIAIAGIVCRAGSLVEVTESEAKNLLGRGKAVPATDADNGAAVAAKTATATDGVQVDTQADVAADVAQSGESGTDGTDADTRRNNATNRKGK